MKYLLLIVIFLIEPFCLAQKYQIRIAPTDNQLSQQTINDLTQDRNGYLWVATNDGLNKYDGTRYKIYQAEPGQTGKLNNNKITSLCCDSNGIIWIGTAKGLHRYVPEKDNFKLYLHNKNDSNTIPANYITDFATDRNGILWISCFGGLCQYNNEKDNFVNYRYSPNDPNTISHYDVSNITIDNQGKLWGGTKNHGYFVKTQNGFQRFHSEWENYFIEEIYIENDDNIWFLAQDNLVIHKKFNKIIIHKNQKTIPFLHPKISFYRNSIKNDFEKFRPIIYHGKSGITWIAGDEIYFDHPSALPFYEIKPGKSNKIISIECIDSSAIWFADDNKKVFSFTSPDKMALIMDSSHIKGQINDIIHYNNTIFFLTNKGIQSYSNNRIIKHNYLPFNEAFHATVSENLLWIASDNGLIALNYDLETLHHFRKINTKLLKSNIIETVYADKNKNIWFSNQEDFYCVEAKDQKIKKYGSYNDYSYKIFCIAGDETGNIWVGRNNGLFLFNTSNKSFRHFTIADGLPGNLIHAIECDKSGNIWISTNSGIAKISSPDYQIEQYSYTDGLQGAIFIKRASCQLPDGTIFMGGTNGFNYFHPDSIISKPVNARPIIEKIIFSLNNGKDSVLYFPEQEITLPSYKYKKIKFTINTTQFLRKENTQLYFKLKGVDADYQVLDLPAEITRQSLKPGNTYILEAYCLDKTGYTSDIIEMKIKIPAHSYRIIYFLIIAAIIAIGIWFIAMGKSNKGETAVIPESEQKDKLSEDLPRNLNDKINHFENEFVQQFANCIVQNIENTNMSVDFIASLLNLSARHLHRKVKEATGQSPNEIIKIIKLEVAKTLLLSKRFNVSEVAWKTGFKHISTFTKSYKAYFGNTPGEVIGK